MDYIYKITSLKSSKAYIGLTSFSVDRRWTQHKSAAKRDSQFHFHKAIRKYGADDFVVEVLREQLFTIEEAEEFEKYYINKFDTYKNGYNSTLGGLGKPDSVKHYTKNKKKKKKSSKPRKSTAEVVKMTSPDGTIFTGTRQELADMIGVSRQNVSRVFRGERTHIHGWVAYVNSKGKE